MRYAPNVELTPRGVQQSFVASVLAVTHGALDHDDLDPSPAAADPWPTSLEIALGELHEGTPVHSLSIQADDESGPALFVIFNDQGNQRDGDAIESVSVTDHALTVSFTRRRGPWSGRVSLASDIEIFEGADPDSVQLDVLRVELADSIDRKALFAAMSAVESIVPGVLQRRT